MLLIVIMVREKQPRSQRKWNRIVRSRTEFRNPSQSAGISKGRTAGDAEMLGVSRVYVRYR